MFGQTFGDHESNTSGYLLGDVLEVPADLEPRKGQPAEPAWPLRTAWQRLSDTVEHGGRGDSVRVEMGHEKLLDSLRAMLRQLRTVLVHATFTDAGQQRLVVKPNMISCHVA